MYLVRESVFFATNYYYFIFFVTQDRKSSTPNHPIILDRGPNHFRPGNQTFGQTTPGDMAMTDEEIELRQLHIELENVSRLLRKTKQIKTKKKKTNKTLIIVCLKRSTNSISIAVSYYHTSNTSSCCFLILSFPFLPHFFMTNERSLSPNRQSFLYH